VIDLILKSHVSNESKEFVLAANDKSRFYARQPKSMGCACSLQDKSQFTTLLHQFISNSTCVVAETQMSSRSSWMKPKTQGLHFAVLRRSTLGDKLKHAEVSILRT
jgi:hypothetical protein